MLAAVLTTFISVPKRGVDIIADTAGDSIGNDTRNLAASWWVSQQKLTPNKHAVENHATDAWLTTDCYNRNGIFRIMRIGNQDFHMLCRDDDGSIRDIMLKRRTNTSREFDMKNAFTPKEGILSRVLRWIEGQGGTNASMPNDAIIFIDDIAP
jgi:hypothetical protein